MLFLIMLITLCLPGDPVLLATPAGDLMVPEEAARVLAVYFDFTSVPDLPRPRPNINKHSAVKVKMNVEELD